MLEGKKINMALLKQKTEEAKAPVFKSSLKFDTLRGTGIPEAYKSNKLVKEYENIPLAILADGWKKGITKKKPTDEEREQFKAIVIVMKHKYGVEFPQGKDKI